MKITYNSGKMVYNCNTTINFPCFKLNLTYHIFWRKSGAKRESYFIKLYFYIFMYICRINAPTFFSKIFLRDMQQENKIKSNKKYSNEYKRKENKQMQNENICLCQA